MKDKLREICEGFFICCIGFGALAFAILLMLIVQPFFWLAIIAIVLITNL